MKTAIFTLALIMTSTAALADQGPATNAPNSTIAGTYRIGNRDCLESGNPYGGLAVIQTQGNNLRLSIPGPRPFSIDMFVGTQDIALANGATTHKAGLLFGNGFAYREETRLSRMIVDQTQYTFFWNAGELTLKKIVRLDPRHQMATYCELIPASLF